MVPIGHQRAAVVLKVPRGAGVAVVVLKGAGGACEVLRGAGVAVVALKGAGGACDVLKGV